ncbi:GspMb/PilO family protein [Variovorax soli]|uniref:GspMb/PilO family protein n=1 Tax=Variovorax soli TaxID=376815 RepID=UPI00286D36E5|nr:GspMb/PilO family protein [Variovorax soli]
MAAIVKAPVRRFTAATRRAAWVAGRARASLHGPMLLALAALCFWLGLAGVVNRPLRQEIRALQKASTALSSRLPLPLAMADPTGREGEDLVRPFLAFLPDENLWSEQLQTLHSLIGQAGVELSRVEYGSQRFEHLQGTCLSLRLTLQADALSFRKLLHDLLTAMPNLAVDRISTERSPDRPDRLSIRLDASLYYRDPRPGDRR